MSLTDANFPDTHQSLVYLAGERAGPEAGAALEKHCALSVEASARNAGFGVIAYETWPSPELISLEVWALSQAAKGIAAKSADFYRGQAEWGATLISTLGGFAF